MKTNRIFALATVLAAAAFAQPAQAFFNVSSSFSRGNSNFGASGAIGAYDNNVNSVYSLNGYGYLTGHVGGHNISVVNGTGQVTFNSAKQGTATANLSLMGQTVVTLNKTFTGTSSFQSSTITKSWGPATVYVPFSVWGVPFKFNLQAGASVSGYLQGAANITYTWPYPQAVLNIGPVANAAGTASAGPGIGNFVSAGVSGAVQLSGLSVNARAKLYNKWVASGGGGGQFQVMMAQYWADYGLDYSTGTVAGNLDLYATVKIVLKFNWSKNFWNGYWAGTSGTLYNGSSRLW